MNADGEFRSVMIYFNCHTGTRYYAAAGWVTALEN